MSFHLGQRWISDSESDQGLGTVSSVEHRFVKISFTATGETRQYAKVSAPLTRVVFNNGDTIPSHEGWTLLVQSSSEDHNLMTYHGIRQDTQEEATLKEIMIDHFLRFNKPHDRLLNCQVDRLDWFRLRKDCLKHQYQQQQSDLTGLTGARVSLIPHQLYIADEVGSRFAPRVLLADEVGLGKTIEAGLIIHQQLVTGRAKRILIIVPESLMHQWLVEMLRRFNLKFSIFDHERCVESSNNTEQENPFSTEQLVLVNLSFITDNPKWYESLIAETWDLMIVDEAHHLHWQLDNPSIEYQCIEQLAQTIPGVLLLTATPDQLGHESHFARLRLLDPDRFFDYQQFTEEELHYTEVANAANALVENERLTAEQENTLTTLLKESDISEQLHHLNNTDQEIQAKVRQQLLKQLLDRHGTGRILFRNSRNTIKGFPARQLVPAALKMPEQYQQSLNEFMLSDCPETLMASKQAKFIFTPEILYGLDHQTAIWTDFDPRVDYLIELLASLKKQKVLVICAYAQTAIDLEIALRVKEGIRSAVFHEGLSIFERDKAAAYFAQDEDSAQLLLCSEIGSEGRNFQFSHHLVLFDLPSNPDLLEQRIGRLDRIGQTEIIRLHVPYFIDSAQHLLFDWYHQGLQAFEHTCITGRVVFESYGEKLLSIALSAQLQSGNSDELSEQLINDSWQKHIKLKAELESGRDKLLELNSSGQGRALNLVDKIEQIDRQIALPQFMFQTFDVFGVQQDDKADNAIVLNQSEHMLNNNFPCLPEDGTTITFDRNTALVNENYQLLTWDHPMVRGVMDLVLSDEIGNTSIGLLKNEALPVGTFFLECLFTIEATAPEHLQLSRYLPTTPIRVLIDKSGNNLANKVSESVLDNQLSPVKKQMSIQLIKALKSQIMPLVTKAEVHASQQITTIQEKALDEMHDKLNQEHQRLTALKAINPSVRQAEIDFILHQQSELKHYIDHAQLTFEAIRMIVVTH